MLELRDGMKALVTGKAHERAAYRKEDGWEIIRHDGVQRIPHTEVERVVHGGEVGAEEREAAKEFIRTDHGVQSEKLHNISQLLRAYSLYEKDVEYVVQDNKVIIVDEFTGRLMPGRRWSDGLHQAVEAKEGVEIERETQTLATITIQNYFRMYKKLAGMTGTAETEAERVHAHLQAGRRGDPHQPPVRRDDKERPDLQDPAREVQRDHRGDRAAATTRSSRCWSARSRVEASELLSRMLARTRIPHNVLNAKNHQREAEIVRFAGQPGAVTIATNMAGRGTDIKLHADVVRKDEKGDGCRAACRSSAPSATRRAASTGSCAAARAARATRAARSSSCRSRTT